MLSWLSRFKTQAIPHKVQTADGKNRKGIAVKSFADLINKAKKALQVLIYNWTYGLFGSLSLARAVISSRCH